MPNVTELNVNGDRVPVNADPATPLLEVLRDQAGLTGAKYGCGEGQCGACTVLVDGEPVRSCLRRVGAVAGQKILTIEGLAPGGDLHPVQQAFLDVEALQCGYCTPGMIMEAVAFLDQTPGADRAAIVRAMEGHICRCGVYPRIVAAIERAAQASLGDAPTGSGSGGGR